jgi:hypothetical protein
VKIASKLLLGLVLLQGAAYAADEPKIEVIDGKISITAQAVPLGRFLSLFDKAMGLKSEVKPGLENRNVSVQFSGLSFNDAVRKIFQGQPFNYVVIQGKGIRVTDVAQAGGADSGPPPFSTSSQPISSPVNNTIQPLQPNPINNPQPAPTSIFGAPPQANAPAQNPSTPLSGPGVMPPPIGANNPLTNPVGGPNAGGNVVPVGPVNQPPQPAAPGTLPGTVPGAAPGTIR